MTKSARTPEVMNVFAPLTMKVSPSRTAVVRMLATSDPPPGSVIASDPIVSPARVGRTKRSTRSSLPAATMWGSAMPEVNRAARRPELAPASAIASVTASASRNVPPLPPFSSGTPRPRNPCFAADRWSSRGTSPASSHSCR